MQLCLQPFDAGVELGDLVSGHGGDARIRIGSQRDSVLQFLACRLELLVGGHHPLEVGTFLGELADLLRVRRDLGVGQLLVNLFAALYQAFEFLVHCRYPPT